MSSEAAQKAYPDDELHTEEEVALKTLERQAFDRGAAAVIAEGWRKKPSRDEVARAIALGVDGVDGEQFDDAAVDYRLEMLQGADAVLALMDREQ